MRKILYSPGYGAGWSSWTSNPEIKKFVLEYQPIIEAIERGEKIFEGEYKKERETQHPLLSKLQDDLTEKFGDEGYFYLGGAEQLRVATVYGRVLIEEYDGSESYVEEGEDQGWI